MPARRVTTVNRREQLRILHKACGGDARKVAFCHILNPGREQLEPEDHDYLDEHLDALTWREHALYLRHAPAHPSRLVDRIVYGFPLAEPGEEPSIVFDNPLALWAPGYPPGVVDELAERLRPPHLDRESWWQIARQIEDVGAPYRAVQRRDLPQLGLVLFEHRRAEHDFPRALAAALGARGGLEGALLLEGARAAGLLSCVRPGQVLPAVLRFQGEPEASRADEQVRRIALAWPGDAAAEGQAWYLDQVVAASARGVLPGVLWTVTPPPLRAAAAFRAQDAGVVVPWLAVSLRYALEHREAGAWERLFRYLDTPHALEPSKLPMPFDAPPFRDGQEPKEGEPEAPPGPQLDRRAAQYPSDFAAGLLLTAPLPADADDAFEAHLLGYPHLLAASGIPGLVHGDLFARIAALPRTPERAGRLLRWGLAGPRLLVDTALLLEIAQVAGPLPEEVLPPAEAIVLEPTSTEQVALYRCIAGTLAEGRLQAWMRAPITSPAPEPHGARARDPFKLVCARAHAAPDLVPVDVRSWLMVEARQQTVAWMLDHLDDEALPWLMDEARLTAAALDGAETEREPWAPGDASRLPASLLPAVRRRVRSRAPGDREVVSLLRWLEARGEPLGELVAAMLAHLDGQKPGHEALAWLGATLSSGARWNHHGRDVLLTLLDAGAWEAIPRLAARVLAEAGSLTDEKAKKKRAALVVALHDALGRALVRIAERAVSRGAVEEAMGALHGLAALHPRSGLRGPVHHLGEQPDLPEEVAQMIALNEELLRRDTTREGKASDLDLALALLEERRAPGTTGKGPLQEDPPPGAGGDAPGTWASAHVA